MKKFRKILSFLIASFILITTMTPIMARDDFTPRKRNRTNGRCPVIESDTTNISGSTGEFGDIFVEGTEANQVARKIFDTLTQTLGLSGASASGIMSNIKGESGFIPDGAELYDSNNPQQTPYTGGVDGVRQGGVLRFGMLNKTPINGMANYSTRNMLGGGGLVQFTPFTRFTESSFWSDTTGWDPGKQMEFMWQEEFANKRVEPYMNGTYSNAGANYYGVTPPFSTVEEFMSTNDPAKASDAFQVGFERPANYHPERREWASAINAYFNKENIKADKTKWRFNSDNTSTVNPDNVISSVSNDCPSESLTMGMLMNPTDNWEENITSNFGARVDPITGEQSFHSGLDIGGAENQNIYAVMDGIVNFAGNMGGYGNVIFITHENGWETRYAHLFKIDVKVGDMVVGGQRIGGMGTTGHSTGIHLHFETRKDGEPIDPLDVLKNPEKHNLPSPLTGLPDDDAFKELLKMNGGTYILGASNPQTRTFDCSGLSSWFIKLWKGISIPRTASQQSINGGGSVVASGKLDISKLKPGDLLFFNTDGSGTASHVGIYIGNGQLLHASTPQRGIVIDNVTSNYYQSTFLNARRY